MATAPWLSVMQSLDGTRAGGDNPTIMAWPKFIAQTYPEMADYCASYTHDSISWCGLTIAYCMAKSGIRPVFGSTDTDRFLWALAWKQFGGVVNKGDEQPGDILVFVWASGGHHVTLYEGKDARGFYICHGGNQSHAVSTQHYSPAYCVGIRRPAIAAVQPPVPAPQPIDPQAATTTAPVPVALQPAPTGPLVPSTGTGPAPLVALAEAAATLVARQLIQASPQGAQIAAELRAQAVIGREIADLVIALLDKVAPVAPAAPAQPLPAPQRPPIALPLPGTPLPDFLQPTASAAPALAHFVGKCSWFGGPNDMGVSPSEGLAIFSSYSQAPNLFLPQQPPGTTGLARRLDPSAYYIACRWDYHRTPVTMLRDQSMQATVRANGREFLAHPADWGPNEKTGRVADLSHGLLTALGISTDDQVEVIYPATKGTTIMSMPSTQPQPSGDTQVAAPLGTVLGSKVNLTQPIAILAQVAAVWIGQKMGLDAMTQGALAVVIQTVVSTATVIFRTWYTTKILPQSLPLPARNQLGV